MQKLAYSLDETRQLTGLGRDSLYQAINTGLLQSKKYGTRTLVPAVAHPMRCTLLLPTRTSPGRVREHDRCS